ncbi:ATP-binding protein [Fluviispira sanaruensis]|uniref:ATP-binding protein n=1 Tax=Fluviispira sanaruensis TaxID=2493639 RepID=A0A4P2VNN1_FLUSA|nr:ATP-binding protein [Fluviispira sanaruensis]BBH53650.1 ATP-binding protein [Fluviispira sanaruensis]
MAKTYSCTLVGVKVIHVEIETVVGSGFSGLNILGLSPEITRDMRERIRSALECIGIPIPARRVVVNITPSDSLKLSRTPTCQLDFAVATSIIYALFQENKKGAKLLPPVKEYLAGEISLSGQIKAIENPLVYFAALHSMQKEEAIFCLPYAKLENQLFTPAHNLEFYASLSEWISARKISELGSIKKRAPFQPLSKYQQTYDSTFMNEQEVSNNIKILAKNPKICVAILIAALSRSHILIAGEPGVGKSFSIDKIIHFLPPLSEKEKIEVKLIHPCGIQNERPFRAPHHSASSAALVGGQTLKPGEASLAHHGILFLDELAEFSRTSLESLREPLDSGQVSLARSGGQITYPAKFQLCATTNPCGCGYLFSRKRPCRCNPSDSKKYLQKLSGPLLDRFSIQLWAENHFDENNLDIFSRHLLEILKKEGSILLSKKIIELQRLDLNAKLRQEIKFWHEATIQANPDFQSLSNRGQIKINELMFYFNLLFPELKKSEHYISSVLSYRILNKMFTENIF